MNPNKSNNGQNKPKNQRQNRPQNGGQRNQNGPSARPVQNNSVLAKTQIRRGEVQRAQRRTSENVNLQASQHVIDVPVNKSMFNGYGGQQFTLTMQKTIPKREGQTLKVIPIGGLGEMGIGKNMSAIEYGNDIIIVDMGFLFPGNDYPGINYIVPDVTYLEERKDKIRGIIFTHGHLDHIGAARHLLHKLPAPIYGGKFTMAMVERIMEESPTPYRPIYNIMNPEAHDRIQLGDSFSVELVRVNHSIPDATAVVIRTPMGVIVNTGDWRFEENPVDGIKFDLPRLEEIAQKEGVMLLMNESTDCEVAGSHEHSELDVKKSIGQIMDHHPSSRLIISCFSSQIHRIQVILEEAAAHGRKVAIAGYSMIQNMEVALRTGAVKVPKDTIAKMEDITKMPDGKVVVLCTGSQGEFNAVLNRMASGAHKFLKVKHTDVIVFSSSQIPGNEKYIVRTVDNLMREGSDVIQDRKTHLDGCGRIHLSGHAYYEDHVKLINALKPKFYMPIHGEFHMLVHNAELAEKECGITRDRIFVCDSGDVLEFDHNGLARKAGRIPVGGIMYDDAGEEVSEVVLKDRIHMASEGMFIVVLTVSKQTGRLLTSPDIISRGFIYLRNSEELMNTIRSYLKQKIARGFGGGRRDLDDVKKELKDEITHILYDQTRRTPIVIPVINEISGGGNSNGGQQKQQASEPAPTPFRALAPEAAPQVRPREF
ncbi:MAG TPA: ribonuclease J [Candidatus Saccharimonas sp.]|nr:ribonuclease J [Candidatus Saccharimonas sp.]